LKEDLAEKTLKVCAYLDPLTACPLIVCRKDQSIWEKLRTENARFAQQYVPLLPSNSPKAKGMRLAMTLAILSREICKNIFQPNYILPEDSKIHGILSHLAENDTKKESFYRQVLLSLDFNAEESLL
jgi:hypothetical protein